MDNNIDSYLMKSINDNENISEFNTDNPSEFKTTSNNSIFCNHSLNAKILFCAILITIAAVYIFMYCQTFITYSSCGTKQIIFINDIHINTKYNPKNGNSSSFCKGPDNPLVTTPYNLGVYNCDSPQLLYSSALQSMKEQIKNPTMVIFGGDSISFTLGVSAEFMYNYWYSIYFIIFYILSHV